MVVHDRYQQVRPVGSGGFAIVYEAIDTRTNRRVAVKEIPVVSDDHGEQIEREVHILSSRAADLPFVPDIYDYWSAGGKISLVMEWIDGPTVWELRDEWWSPERAEEFLRTMLGYLVQLHARGIVHRDLHPKNIKLDPLKGYVLLDFGIAKDGQYTLALAKAAQPHYAPLEQLAGDRTDARADLYALAATTYHLLMGAPPPTAFERQFEGVPLRLPRFQVPEIPIRLETTLLRMLELNADNRPASAAVAIEMLDRSVVSQPAQQTADGYSAQPPAQRVSVQPGTPRRPIMPPLQQARHTPPPHMGTASGCVLLPLIMVGLLIFGGLWWYGGFAAVLDPLVDASQPARPMRTPVAIAALSDPTEVPQPTPASPPPAEVPRPTSRPTPPAETPQPIRSPEQGMYGVTTAQELGPRFRPEVPSSTFSTNEQVYVSYQINEAEAGEVVTFRCFSGDDLWWEGTNTIAQGGNYRGYFVIGPLRNRGTYRGELQYQGEVQTVSWEVR